MFHNVGPSAGSLALLPQENSIFGVVTETYDLLRSSELGERKWIRGAVTLSVQHCLIVRRGKTMRDIKRVLSHEQVRIYFFGRSLAEVVCLTQVGRIALRRAASRLWDSVRVFWSHTCQRQSWSKYPRRLQLRKRYQRRQMTMVMMRTARQFAPRSACNSSII